MTCKPVASYEFSGIPKRKAGASRIRVLFGYNENNVVKVSAFDVLSDTPLQKREQPLVDLLELRSQLEEKIEPPRRVQKQSVALLIDSSGSMLGDMENAKAACHRFIDETDFNAVEMGLVQFGIDSKASTVHGISKDSKSLRRAVDKLHADGGTPMAEAVRLGTQMVSEGNDDAGHFIVLFTDGHPDNRAATLKAGEEAKAHGIQILCIGIGSADQSLLDALATTRGQVHFKKSSEDLPAAFGDIAQLISGRQL